MKKKVYRRAHENVNLVLSGGRVNKIRLGELGAILSAYQRMMDRAYFAYQGKARPGRIRAKNFQASVKKFDKGSIDISLLVEFVALTNTAMATAPISTLVEAALLYFRSKSAKSENPPRNGGNNNNPLIDIKGDGNIVIVGDNARNAVNMMKGPARDIIRHIDKGAIASLRVRTVPGVLQFSQGQRMIHFSITREDVDLLDSVLAPNRNKRQ